MQLFQKRCQLPIPYPISQSRHLHYQHSRCSPHDKRGHSARPKSSPTQPSDSRRLARPPELHTIPQIRARSHSQSHNLPTQRQKWDPKSEHPGAQNSGRCHRSHRRGSSCGAYRCISQSRRRTHARRRGHVRCTGHEPYRADHKPFPPRQQRSQTRRNRARGTQRSRTTHRLNPDPAISPNGHDALTQWHQQARQSNYARRSRAVF